MQERGYAVTDLGTFNEEPSDYPDQARQIANAILHNETERGIFICGSGVGACVAVNKFKGIRGALCHDVQTSPMPKDTGEGLIR